MFFSRFKTSTRIALIFTLFSSIILLVFVGVLNTYYFYNWRLDEGNEVTNRTEQLATRIFKPENRSGATISNETNQFIKRILEQ